MLEKVRAMKEFTTIFCILNFQDPSVINRYKAGLFSPAIINESETFQNMFGGQLKYLSNIIKTWPGYEKIGDKLYLYYKNFSTNLVKSAARRSTEITVLNHGDLWVNNFMFKYGTNHQKPIDLLLVVFFLK